MPEAFICDYVRTPIGRYGGALSSVRTDDLAAIPLREMKNRNPTADWKMLDEVYMGCANQAGEDNRNIARMALLLAGYSEKTPGTTINRLCGSGMDAVASAARAIKSGEIDFAIAGGVESMSRAPFVIPKASQAFARENAVYDTTIGWRFINPAMRKMCGVDSMPETAENVAEEFNISRGDQDQFAHWSQQKAGKAQASGRFDREIKSVEISKRKNNAVIVSKDEHLRPQTTLEDLWKLNPPFRQGGCVTAGNASGVNDGAAVLILASEKTANKNGLKPIARVIASATTGVPPRIMGFGPSPAIKKLLQKTSMSLRQFDVIELNEAFASQVLAVTRDLGLSDTDPRININGGAIAMGHPLGMSGARITGTAALELVERKSQYALASMCVGVGQGIAIALERVG